MPRQDLIKLRRGTADEWTTANPTLSAGEYGFETDTRRSKIGDGSTAWNDLEYLSVPTSSNIPPIENVYEDIASLLGSQGSQTTGFIQEVTDASADPNIDSGTWFYKKKADSTSSLSNDYTPLNQSEVTALLSGQGSETEDCGTVIPLDTIYGNNCNMVTPNTNVNFVIDNQNIINAYTRVKVNISQTDLDNASLTQPNISGATQQGGIEFEADTDLILLVQNLGDAGLVYSFQSVSVGASSGGGSDSITWQTEITTDTTFNGSQKGAFNFYPVNSSSAVVITIDKGTYAVGDVVCFNRRGSGSVEIERGTDVRLNNVRDNDNRFFINDIGSDAFVQFSHLDGSTLVGNVIGNITGGYEGAVIATNYSELREGDTGVNLTITGSGLSNALISFSTGITLNSIVSTSNNEMVVNVDVTALETETVTPTFDNGDITVDTDAITIAAAPPATPTYDDYVAWYKFETATPSDETGNYNGTNNGATVITGQVNNAYAFDGVNDYVSGLGDLGITGFPVTFDFWLRVPDVSGFKWFGTDSDQFNYKGIFPYLTDAKFGIQYGDGAGTGSTDRKNFISTNDVITANTWHHISVILTDINTIELKVDNATQAIPFSSGTASTVSFTGVDYQFGRRSFGGVTYYEIDLDEFKVWDRALTGTEQTDIHTLESGGNSMI